MTRGDVSNPLSDGVRDRAYFDRYDLSPGRPRCGAAAGDRRAARRGGPHTAGIRTLTPVRPRSVAAKSSIDHNLFD
jgi:hypothetical protein